VSSNRVSDSHAATAPSSHNATGAAWQHPHAAASPTTPGGVPADALRGAMGQFATGVTVITTRDCAGQAFGTTANAVTSVSLRPPLVLACLRRESETLAALLQRRRFAVNVLRSSQTELSDRFARRAADDTWETVAHRNVRDIPVLEGAIATLECDLHDVADGGDHAVVVGHVLDLSEESADAEPLLFYAGSYRRLGNKLEIPTPPQPTEVALPARDGPLRILSLSDDEEQTSVAVLTGTPRGRRGVLVYPHVPCLLGDALGSTACRGRTRLLTAMTWMREEGHGVAVYHRDAGAGLDSCGCTGAGEAPELSDDAVDALARAVRALDLRAVRLVCTVADGRRAARAGVPIGELIDHPSLAAQRRPAGGGAQPVVV
jgi:flavin reductase (DIM6/NTAB) family NADH-FMN oxidoreductase RutF/GTP cyclohydrolase II